jgi:hypothetical protein
MQFAQAQVFQRIDLVFVCKDIHLCVEYEVAAGPRCPRIRPWLAADDRREAIDESAEFIPAILEKMMVQ